MTDLDAAGYLRELMDYNSQGLLKTPQNKGMDTFWQCAFEHAIRALEQRSGYLSPLEYAVSPNGSRSAVIPEKSDGLLEDRILRIFESQHSYFYPLRTREQKDFVMETIRQTVLADCEANRKDEVLDRDIYWAERKCRTMIFPELNRMYAEEKQP